jgi:hypothetical protein
MLRVPEVVPSLSYQTASPTSAYTTNGSNPPTPARASAHASEKGSVDHAPYVTYPTGNGSEAAWTNVEGRNTNAEKFAQGWVPLPLRAWFWIPFMAFMILTAIGLEIALFYSNQLTGWPTSGTFVTGKYSHYATSSPPIVYSMFIVALWTWTDLEIRRMQPYIDLSHGRATAEKSLLLDYTTTSKFLVWITAYRNHHYMVATVAIIGIITLVVNPLAPAMFTITNVLWGPPAFPVNNAATLGLNLGPEYHDLTVFLSAAGFASSSVLYGFGDPPFIHDEYTIGNFVVPILLGANGTVTVNTTAVKTDVNCHLMSTQSTNLPGGGWKNDATFNGCTFSYSVNQTANHLFGTSVMPDCNNTGVPDPFRPVVLWFFTYDTSPPQGSATYCAPSISLWDVTAVIDVATKNLTSVQEIGPVDINTSPFAGPPMYGQAYNGIAFNLTGQDQFVLNRANAIQLQLPASIFQAASAASGNLAVAFEQNSFVGLATQVYGIYMKLVASILYFSPSGGSVLVTPNSYQQRLLLSDLAVHAEAAILSLVALVGAFVQVCHRKSRQQLQLRHVPGTLAAAISMGADPNLIRLFNNPEQLGDFDFANILQNKEFGIDRQTMRIVSEGDEGR